MPTQTKRLRTTLVGTASFHPPGFAGTAYLKPQPVISPSDGQQEPKEERETATPRPLRITTSLKPVVESHNNVSGSTSGHSTPTCSSPSRHLLWDIRQHTLGEMIVFLAFISASATLFSALAGIGYVPNEADRSVRGWQAPGLDAVSFSNGMISEPSIFQSLLRRTGRGRNASHTEDDEAGLYLDEEIHFWTRTPWVSPASPLWRVAERPWTHSPSVASKSTPTHERPTTDI